MSAALVSPPTRALSLFSVSLVLAAAAVFGQQEDEGEAPPPTYSRDVLPVLEAKCVKCHGGKRQKAELRLDSFEAVMEGCEYGPVLVPKEPLASALIQVLHLPLEHDRHMPPEGKEQLTEAEIELLTEWVRAGALPGEIREEDEATEEEAGSEGGGTGDGEGADETERDLAPELPPLELDLTGPIEYPAHVRPILDRYCFRCHGPEKQKGKVRLDVLDPDLVAGSDEDAWELALGMIQAGVMPPSDVAQPTDPERRALVGWIRDSLKEAARANAGERDAVLRRLNRAQYTHTLQDLLGLQIDFGQVLPGDGKSKTGFTNNGEVLQASPLHLDYYQTIAREALDQAIVVGDRPAPTWYRVTFGKGIGAGLVSAETGGYQSVPLSADDFVVEILDGDGAPKEGATEEEQAELDDLKRRITVGLRGSSHSRFRITEDGMILYGARPHVEKVPKAWQGPSPNLKLEMQRCFPERGDFLMRVSASRGHLVSSRELLLIDLEDPVPQVALVEGTHGPDDPKSEEPEGVAAPAGAGDGGASTATALELALPEGARVLRAVESDEHANVLVEGDTLLAVEATAESSARLQIELPEAGYYQIDLVHPASPPDAMPSVRLSLGKLTLDRRLLLSEEELERELAVTALGAAYLPQGRQTLKVGGPFFCGFRELVLTPLAEDHPAVAPFTEETEELARAVAKRTPSLRAFLGTRTDDGMDYETFDEPQDVLAPLGAPETYTFRGRLENLPIPEPDTGDTEILSGFLLLGVWNDHLVKTPEDPGPPILVHSIEFEAPWFEEWPPASHTRIFFPSPHRSDEERYTREVLTSFLSRAFRRAPREGEVERYLAFWREARSDFPTYEEGVREVLVAALCSPHFLYLAEVDDSTLSQDALASRLSYFLWNSPPDGTLRRLANEGVLHEELVAQSHRLLDDPRAWRFVQAFAEEWLRLDRHYGMTLSPDVYPAYTRFVKRDMALETAHFLHEVLREDLSIFTLIDSDFAMLNQNLAEFYGVDGVLGTHFRRVPVAPELGRGGLLSQGAFLAGHSDGVEPHPIKRAVWLKEKILGDPPPPPPPNVPDLDPKAPGFEGLSLSEQLERHRESPSCHDCHAGIDPYGLVFEEYDAAGILVEERNGAPVEAKTELPDGTRVDGVAEMKAYIRDRVPDEFARGLSEHLFAYALGRDVHYGDEDELDAILEHVRRRGYAMRSVVEGIVTSPSFTQP